jgi:HK97 family phage prohead protease
MGPLVEKNFDAVVKDVDTKKGIVEGYFSTWGIIDSDGDELMPGAYVKTLQENGPGTKRERIMHLWQHSSRHPMGRFTEEGSLKEDKDGLFFRSKISRTTYGKDALQLYDDGVINEHSVGIQIIKNQQAGEGHSQVLEVKLWEGSTVTWGANENTPVTAVKDQDPKQMADKFNERIEILSKALKDGTYTDETFVLLELQLKQIQGHYQSLITKLEPGSPTPHVIKPTGDKVSLESIFNNFKI